MGGLIGCLSSAMMFCFSGAVSITGDPAKLAPQFKTKDLSGRHSQVELPRPSLKVSAHICSYILLKYIQTPNKVPAVAMLKVALHC